MPRQDYTKALVKIVLQDPKLPEAAAQELQELLSRPDSAAYESRIRELQDQIAQEIAAHRLTWKDVRVYGFITDNEEAKATLETLITEIFKRYSF